jgi:microsomal dipeptidase-like Zn-dependent dipeptidase
MKRFLVVGGLVLLAVVAYAFTFAPDHATRLLNRVSGPPLQPVADESKRLHDSLWVTDLHCDALLWGRDLLERADYGHVDVPRLIDGNVALQVFSVVTQVPLGMSYEWNTEHPDVILLLALTKRWPRKAWFSSKERALYQARRFHAAVEGSGGRLRWVGSAADIEASLAERETDPATVAGLLAIEGLHGLDEDVGNVDVLFEAGFRMMAPTHFFDNEMGGSAHGVGKGGLTPFGRKVIQRMEERRVIIDLAHASPELFDDVIDMATRPLVVSHTGVRGTKDSVRNLTDAQIVAVARTGGVVGIGFWKGAVGETDPVAIARAIRHVTNLVGVDHAALGSDFDGATWTAFDGRGFAHVTEALVKDGFSNEEIRKIMGGNAIRVLLETLPSS